MLDVHPPHTATHTWADFFIHIATIVVGLLIAVGLEQTVEAIHHRHERGTVTEEMRAEAERNRPVLMSNIRRAKDAQAWAQQALTALQQARAASGPITVTLPQGVVPIDGDQPSHAVWDIAKANGKAALVSDDLAEMYDRQAWEAQGESDAVSDVIHAERNLYRFSARVQTPVVAGATLHLSQLEADMFLDLLSDRIASTMNVQFWNASWLGAADAIAAGAHSREAIGDAMTRRHAEVGY